MTLYRTLPLTLFRTHTLTLTQVRGPRYDPKLHTGHIGWRRTAHPERYPYPYPYPYP